MIDHTHRIGAFEAKTHLADFLRRAEQGESFVIHRRGRPVARLVPFEEEHEELTLAGIADVLGKIRSRIDGPISIRELIEDGRRY